MKKTYLIPYRAYSVPMIVTPAPLPSATQGQAYSTAIAAVGGSQPLTYSATGLSGTGLSISSTTGVISGTAGAPTTASVTVTATDVLGRSGTRSYSLVINVSNAPTINTSSPLPSATVGVAYSCTLSASGGAGAPYTWAVLSDSPDTGSWLSINATTGVLSGTPGTAETEVISIKVTDSGGNSATAGFSLTVNPVNNWASAFPLKASYRIGNPQAYGSAFQAWAQSQNLAIISAQFEAGNAGGFLAANGYTKQSVVDNMHAAATAPGGIKVLQYVIFDTTSSACGPMVTIADNSNFYLYQTNQSGTKIAAWSGSGYQYNATPDTAANSNGYHLEDAAAAFSYQTFVTPGGNGNNATSFDGFFHDNLFKQPRTNSGDYLVNGTTQSASNSTVAAAWRQGEALFFSQMNSQQSGMILLGNLDGPASRTSYNGVTEYSNLSGGVINGGLLEDGLGIYFGPPTYAGLMAEINFRKQVAQGSSLPMVLIGAINMTSNGELPTAFSGGNPSAYSAPYQGERYAMGINALAQTSGGISMPALLVWTTSTGYYDNQALFDFDEFGGNTAKYGPGYLGAPVGSNVTLTNGLVCQLFANGLVVVNPGGNGAQSFNQTNLTTLGVSAAYRLRGPQNPSFNNAAQVTNAAPVSLADSGGYCGDAVFLMYAPQ